MRGDEYGTPFSATATNATSAVATQTGAAGKKSYITDISGSSDLATAVLLVKDGTTIIWQDRIANGSYATYQFKTPLVGTAGADVSVTVNGTALCDANIAGYVI